MANDRNMREKLELKSTLRSALAQIEQMEKALQFYSSKEYWYISGAIGIHNHIIDCDSYQEDNLRWVNSMAANEPDSHSHNLLSGKARRANENQNKR